MAEMVVPAGEVDRLAQLHRVLAGLAQHDGGADRGLHDEVVGDLARQAEQDAGVGHRFDQEEEVGRSRPGQRRSPRPAGTRAR